MVNWRSADGHQWSMSGRVVVIRGRVVVNWWSTSGRLVVGWWSACGRQTVGQRSATNRLTAN
eukprot:8651365-Lingulodinium_polyedra.AAC.1